MVLGMLAARDAGVPIAEAVKAPLQQWITSSQTTDGGFGYHTAGYWNNIAKTASGLVSLHLLGEHAEDDSPARALSFIDTHWR